MLLEEESRDDELASLLDVCLAFVLDAALPSGRFRNRRSVGGRWLDDGPSDDTWGRALVALGGAAVRAPSVEQRHEPLACFCASARAFVSPWPRPNALAVLAAVTVLREFPSQPEAEGLLERAAGALGAIGHTREWPWPDSRLTYANALLPEARIAAGAALSDELLLEEGLELLAWLARVETRGGHFSFTPASGWAPGEPRPGFDQQPIEAGAMAVACERALTVTGDSNWQKLVQRAAAWFLGENDVGSALYDPSSGGCRDGLERSGCNENQGAESTLAMIAAFQAAARSAAIRSAATTDAAPTQRSAAP